GFNPRKARQQQGFPVSINPLGILHNQRLTEYNKIFGACKGARDFRIIPPGCVPILDFPPHISS
ncbi:MAG: hypothetical protein QGG39_15920, partial [Candidatus Poribacteria bacterium]|nr:hypothetical protein [Candidatus Poribacteria bacterium]